MLRMNYLAHAFLARRDEGLLVGGLMGDHIRGLRALRIYPQEIRRGIRLHRYIDRITDQHEAIRALLRRFPRPFRRYAGIIVDLAFDHELARHWGHWGEGSLSAFDREVRAVLGQHKKWIPPGLNRFMAYADERGLLAAYADEQEMLRSLAGVGKRLRRSNPLHQVGEIWPQVKAPCHDTFVRVFPLLQSDVEDWIKRTSTSTGS